jgi:hypothetical protein
VAEVSQTEEVVDRKTSRQITRYERRNVRKKERRKERQNKETKLPSQSVFSHFMHKSQIITKCESVTRICTVPVTCETSLA